uniref:Uncharacterized protein n=1 Tax=Rhizophora mucronata TaxID=61149 RepID=A0A2P2Q294_RHIMU
MFSLIDGVIEHFAFIKMPC